MSLSQQVLLRYRAPGHVRFALPSVLCEPTEADRLVALLEECVGVYRVDLFRRQRKLSIRYTEGVCRFSDVANALNEHVSFAEINPAQPVPSCCAGTQIVEHPGYVPGTGVTGWVKGKAHEFRETLVAFGIVARSLVKRNPSNPTAIVGQKYVGEFFTDALVLYLIKLHWHMITQHWLKRPWLYRYEWMAALYLIYLLVKSKRPKTT